MAVFDNLNLTTASGVAPSVVQYYERTLLQNARDELVHARDLQKRTLPRHNGKTVQFRRMSPFTPDTTPLQEGVTPTGQALAMSEITATIKPYGRHVELTDEMDWALLDNVHRETANELSFQALGTIDMVAANALNSGLNVIYVDAQNGVNTARSDITAADILTHAAIKRAVRTLEQNNAPKFADGYYHAIIDPETKYDLTSDPLFTDVAKYQDKSKVDKYELGTIYGVKFYMSNRTKTFPTGATLFGSTTNYALASGTAASKTATIAGATVSATAATVEQFCRTIAGMEVQIYDHSVTSYFPAVVERARFDGTTITLNFRWMGSANWEYAAGDKIYGPGTGASNYEVHSTIVYGRDCAGSIELDGNGKNVEIIIKPNGSSGGADPLNQRATIAWKVKGFCATILQDAFIVRIEHGVTA